MGYERKAARFPVHFSSTFAGEQLAGRGTIANLSIGGCSIESRVTLTVQSIVGLRIQIPDSPHPLQVEQANVRWACGNRFGLEFEQMSQAETGRLEQLLYALEHRPLAIMPQPGQ